MTGSWGVVPSGYRMWGAAEARCERAVTRVRDAGITVRRWPQCDGGLSHEAGDASSRATLLRSALAEHEVVVLGNGPIFQLPLAGDAVTAQLLDVLDNDLRGTAVGAMWHAYFLSELVLRAPGMSALVATPFTEVLGHPNPPFDVRTATSDFIESVSLWSVGDAYRPHTVWTGVEITDVDDVALSEKAVAPRVARPGTVRGRILAANLAELCINADRRTAERWEGAILHLELSHLLFRTADNYLQRLRHLGILDAVGAVVVGVPLAVPQAAAMPWPAIIDRALEGIDVVAVVDAFAGAARPAPRLPLGVEAVLRASDEGVVLEHVAAPASVSW